MTNQSKITVLKFNACPRNTLMGFVDIRINTTTMIIRGIPLHQKGDSRWIALPSKSYKMPDNEKVHWQPIIEFEDKSIFQRFQGSVLQAFDLFQSGQGAGYGHAA